MRSVLRIPYALYLLICFGNGILFTGCNSLRNEVNPSQLGIEKPKLVVTCFLSPQDTVLTAKVTRSTTVVGDSISLTQTGNDVKNLFVGIWDGKNAALLAYIDPPGDSLPAYYRAPVTDWTPKIIAGHSYTLLVVDTTSYESVTSTCTIPEVVPLKDIKVDSLNNRYYVQTCWQDPSGQANYYQVVGSFLAVSNLTSSLTALSFDDTNRGLYSDAGYDGSLMPVTPGRAYLPSLSGKQTGLYNQYKAASVLINLMSVDQNYYQFQLAVTQQRRSRNNPFAEPVLIPSNIKGGLGCFAGYNNSVRVLKLK